LQKLRTLATLSGFELIDSRFMRLSKGSLFLFPFFYPFILLSSYTRFLNKKIKLRKHPQRDIILSIYLQQLRLNISIKELLNKHTFLILRKICNSEDFSHNNNENYKPFGKIM
ncbi:MAG: hypothetical protein N2449_09770, partial [Bacteroidales bacterium]|nr:hypothetical protein [Bacteroidales bacterium]